MPMSAHNIREDNDRWNNAVAQAAAEGTTLSALIRQWIEDYLAGNEANTKVHYGRDKLIADLRQQGCTLKTIASVTDLSISGVSRALKRLT